MINPEDVGKRSQAFEIPLRQCVCLVLGCLLCYRIRNLESYFYWKMPVNLKGTVSAGFDSILKLIRVAVEPCGNVMSPL